MPADTQTRETTGVALADAEGIQALTMRRLAADLGVEAMSLYYHRRGKDGLLDGLVEAVIEEIHAAVGGLGKDPVTTEWRTLLRQRFLAARNVMLRHPWAPGLIGSRPTIPAGVYAYYDEIVAVLVNAGFSYRIAHRALHAFGSMALGFAQEIFRPAPADGGADVDVAEAELATMGEALPHLAAMVATEAHDAVDPTLSWCDSQVEFEFALDLLLDGLDHFRESPPASGSGKHSVRSGS